MAVDDDFVIVRKGLFDYLRQHCEHCPGFSQQLQDLSDAHVFLSPRGYSSGDPSAKKRKILHASESQGLSQPEPQQPELQQPELQLPESQEPRTQLTPQSSNTSQGRNPKRPGVKRSRKTEAAVWFLRNAPKAADWRKRQTELELNTVKQYEEAIRAFTNRANVIPKRQPHQRDEQSQNGLVDLAEKFALLTRDSLINADF